MPRPGTSLSFDRVAERYDTTRGGDERGRRLARVIAPRLIAGAPCLEIGVGTGVVAAGLVEFGYPVVGVDLSELMLGKARSRLGPRVAVVDAHELAVRAGAVDNVCIVWVLHVVANPGVVLGEARRVLRGRGRLAVVSGRPRSGDDTGDDDMTLIDRSLAPLRPVGDDPQTVVDLAHGVGFHLLDETEVTNQFDQSPDVLARNIEDRVLAFLWDVDEGTWDRVVRPVIEGLRSLPEPNRPRRRTLRHDLLVFERTPV